MLNITSLKGSGGTVTLGYSGQQIYATVVYAGQNPPLSESFDLTYDGLHRLSTLTRDSDHQVVTYSYDASMGRLSSLNLSDEGTFSFSYQSNGKLQRVTYPGQQGTEDYSYDSEGRLQSIEFPNNSILSFTRTGRKDIQSAQFTDIQNTVYRYDFTYDDQAQLISSNYSIDSLQMESWSYYWGPQGLEYANRSGGQALTQNFSTDPRGRILSMTYGSASYSGELYFHYDALGNTTLLTDAGGNPKASFIYDLHTGKILDSWNPDNLVVINLNQGIGGNLGFELPEGNKVYVPSAKHRLKTPFELYLEMQRMRYADGSPLLSGDQSPVFPKDPGEFGYVDPFTGPLVSWWDLLDAMDLTHQDQSARNGSGYQAYDPQRAYMDRGGSRGGFGPTCEDVYESCMKSCDNQLHKDMDWLKNKYPQLVTDLSLKGSKAGFFAALLAAMKGGAQLSTKALLKAVMSALGIGSAFGLLIYIVLTSGFHLGLQQVQDRYIKCRIYCHIELKRCKKK